MGLKMKAKGKTYLLIWLGIVFALFLAISIISFHETIPWLMVVFEIVIPMLFGFTVWIVNRSFKPIDAISKSMNLLREEDFATTFIKSGATDVRQIIETYNSMINRLRAERLTVREQNHFLDLLIDSSPLGIVILDFDEKVVKINPSGKKYLDLEKSDILDDNFADIDNPLVKQLIKLDFDQKRIVDLQDDRKYLCRKLFFMDHGFKHPFYMIEELTDEIRDAEKEAYSKLIRMMAHEVNNTIGAVNSIVSTIQTLDPSKLSEESDEIISMLEVAVQRNHQLNRFMQNFSNVVKLPLPDKTEFDLCKSIQSVIKSFQPVFNENNIKVNLDLPAETLVLHADQSQLELVWINLIKNSVEAITKDGIIEIALIADPLVFSILDSGIGISPETSENLFTPFYSTKASGQGIGLTLIREILINHGYTFQFQNHDTGGAEFRIDMKV